MQIRNYEPINLINGKDAVIVPKKELNTGMLQWADQILVGTNATRVNINNQMRELKGCSNKPENGDKVICLRNYWDCIADNEDPLVNGTIGTINDIYETYNRIPPWIKTSNKNIIKVLRGSFISDSGADFGSLQMDENEILTGERCLDYKAIYRLMANPRTQSLVPMEFTYAYAITVHKSQGSSWPNILIIEENFPFDREEHARWLYTAVTRSENKLVLVR